VLPWANRVEVFRSAGWLLLVLLAGALGYQLAAGYGEISWAWSLTFFNIIVASWLAITVHRLVLLDALEAMPGVNGRSMSRLLRFLLGVVVVWAIYTGVKLLLMALAFLPFSRYVPVGEPAPPLDAPTAFWMIDLGTSVLAWFALGRLSLVLPVIATDQPLNPRELWRAGRGSSWRLAIVVGALPFSLQLLVDALYRDGATNVETALLLLLMGGFLVVQVVALSLSYRALTAHAPQTSDPLG